MATSGSSAIGAMPDLNFIPAQAPPVGQTSNLYDHPASRQSAIIGVCTVFFVLTAFSVALRVYTNKFITRCVRGEDCESSWSLNREDSLTSGRCMRVCSCEPCEPLLLKVGLADHSNSWYLSLTCRSSFTVRCIPSIRRIASEIDCELVSYMARHMWDVPAAWLFDSETYWHVSFNSLIQLSLKLMKIHLVTACAESAQPTVLFLFTTSHLHALSPPLWHQAMVPLRLLGRDSICIRHLYSQRPLDC